MRWSAALLSLFFLLGCGTTADPTPERTGSASPQTTAASTPTPSSTPSTEPSSPPSSKPSRKPRVGTEIIVADSEFGPMLYDATGQAIYLFDVETTSQPACYGECAAAWPPVFTDGKPVAGDGVRSGLLGTTRRDGGQRQVTYNGHPLYFYAHEGKYDVRCHDVFLNGGNWYVVQPDGNSAPPG